MENNFFNNNGVDNSNNNENNDWNMNNNMGQYSQNNTGQYNPNNTGQYNSSSTGQYDSNHTTVQSMGSYNYGNASNNYKPAKAEASKESKWALALTIIGCTWIFGVALAIIDLLHQDGRRKTFSIAALIVAGIYLIIGLGGREIRKRDIYKRSENAVEERTVVPEENVDQTTELVTESTTVAATEATTETTESATISVEEIDVDKPEMEWDSSTATTEELGVYNITFPSYKGKEEKEGAIYYEINDGTYMVSLVNDTGKDFSNFSDSYIKSQFRDLINKIGIKEYRIIDTELKDLSNLSNSTVIIEKAANVMKDKPSIIKSALIVDKSNGYLIFLMMVVSADSEYSYDNIFNSILDSVSYKEGAAVSSGLGNDFKEMMDSYESFMDKYIEVLQKMNADPTNMDILSDYYSLLTEYTNWADKIEKLDESELTDEELKYYMEVTGRVSQKMINAGLSLDD